MNKKLSILIPVYNEEKTIFTILNKINESKIENFDFEVIVINDGSTDNTLKILQENQNLYDQLLNYEKNQGKGFAVKNGLKVVTGDYVIFQDADLEYDPSDYIKFTSLINKLSVDIIIGSRFNYSDYTRSHNIANKIGNHILTFICTGTPHTEILDITKKQGISILFDGIYGSPLSKQAIIKKIGQHKNSLIKFIGPNY